MRLLSPSGQLKDRTAINAQGNDERNDRMRPGLSGQSGHSDDIMDNGSHFEAMDDDDDDEDGDMLGDAGSASSAGGSPM